MPPTGLEEREQRTAVLETSAKQNRLDSAEATEAEATDVSLVVACVVAVDAGAAAEVEIAGRAGQLGRSVAVGATAVHSGTAPARDAVARDGVARAVVVGAAAIPVVAWGVRLFRADTSHTEHAVKAAVAAIELWVTVRWRPRAPQQKVRAAVVAVAVAYGLVRAVRTEQRLTSRLLGIEHTAIANGASERRWADQNG